MFGVDAVAEPPSGQPFVPHVAILYGRARTDTDGLASRVLYRPAPGSVELLRPVQMEVSQVLVASQDTWSEQGLNWDEASARRIALGAGSGQSV